MVKDKDKNHTFTSSTYQETNRSACQQTRAGKHIRHWRQRQSHRQETREKLCKHTGCELEREGMQQKFPRRERGWPHCRHTVPTPAELLLGEATGAVGMGKTRDVVHLDFSNAFRTCIPITRAKTNPW